MDNYHLYEEIGKGRFSLVFKGREKKTIEYVAVKRTEKQCMSQIVNEVQIMHKLYCPHILRFYNWYQTNNYFWIILEYCTGGSLESLLAQDGYLPESSVRMFGLDLVSGLKHIHSAGFVYCDLCPKNILIDEYGILKIADFKFCRRIPKVPLGETPIEARGSPPYMAPELFAAEGVHSIASDFWALGCLLYELRRGVPPFGTWDTKISELIENIRSSEPIEHPTYYLNLSSASTKGSYSSNTAANIAQSGNFSIPPVTSEFADLLMWLMEKAPMNRCNWVAMATHPFWGEDAADPPKVLPQQPVFDNLAKNLERARSHQMEVASMAEFGMQINGEFLYPSESKMLVPPAVGDTPVRLMKDKSPAESKQSQGRNDPNLSAKGSSSRGDISQGSRSQGKPAAESKGVSAPAEEKLGSAPFPSAIGNGSMKSPGQLALHYMVAANNVVDDIHAADDKMITPTKDKPRGETGQEPPVTPATASRPTSRQQLPATNPLAMAANDPLEKTIRDVALDYAISAKGNHKRDTTESAMPAIVMPVPVDFPSKPADPGTPVVAPPSGAPKGLLEKNCDLMPFNLILHSSDLQVKPIVGNKAIETIEKVSYKSSTLQPFFNVLSADEVDGLSISQLDSYLTQAYKALQKCTQPSTGAPNNAAAANGTLGTLAALTERANVFSYLISIATIAEVANTVLNTQFLNLILKSLRQTPGTLSTNAPPSSSSRQTPGIVVNSTLLAALTHCRILAATVLALLIRYATTINPPASKNREDHIIPTLVSLLREGSSPASTAAGPGNQKIDPRLKRRGIAALGELVFYIAAQLEGGIAMDGGMEDDLDGRDKWVLPVGAVNVILKCLKDDSDEVVRHYAAKTVENVLAQGGAAYKKKFLLSEMAIRLLEMSQNSGNEALQITCGMAASHIIHQVMITNSFPMDSTTPASGLPSSAAVTNRPGANSPGGISSKHQVGGYPTTPSPVCGGKFISRVVEKGGLPGIIEILRDGPTRLQQAYLNIVNIILCPNLFEYTNGCTRDGQPVTLEDLELAVTGSTSTDGMALKPIRAYFLKAGALLPVLPRLIEQGASSATRAKALLSCQLMCIHYPALLSLLAEKRLTFVLMRIAEPLLSYQGLIEDTSNANNNNADANNDSTLSASAPASVTYIAKAALSMMVYIKSLAADCISLLGHQMNLLASNPEQLVYPTHPPVHDPSHEYNNLGDVPGFTPLKPGLLDEDNLNGNDIHGHTKTKSPSTLVKHLTPQTLRTPDVEHLSKTPAPTGSNSDGPDSIAIKQAVAQLRAVMFVVSPHPTMRRILLSEGDAFVESLAAALKHVFYCRKYQQQQNQLQIQPNVIMRGRSEPDENDLMLLLREVELTLLGSLETLSQVGIMEGLLTLQQQLHLQQYYPQQVQLLSLVVPTTWQRLYFMDSLLGSLLPAASELIGHNDGDVRVVAASALRRLVPLLLKSVVDLQSKAWAYGMNEWATAFNKRVNKVEFIYGISSRGLPPGSIQSVLLDCLNSPALCMRSLFPKVSSLLTDHAPIPQGAVRLLLDAFVAVPAQVGYEIALELKRSGCLHVLIHMLRTSVTTVNASPSPSSLGGQISTVEDDGSSPEKDPQLLVLLRVLMERTHVSDIPNSLALGSGSIPLCLLEGDIATSVVIAITQCLPIGGFYSVDIMMPMMDLLFCILNFSIRSLAQAQQQQQQQQQQTQRQASPGSASSMANNMVETLRKHIAPIRSLCSWLFGALLVVDDCNGFIELPVWSKATGGSNSTDSMNPDDSHDAAFIAEKQSEMARILSQLKDVAARCLGILFDVFPDAITTQLLIVKPIGSELPRCVISFLLVQPQVELRTRMRLLKILLGVQKMSSALGVVPRVRDMLQAQDLRSALLDVANRGLELIATARHTEEEYAQLNAFTALARQLLTQHDSQKS